MSNPRKILVIKSEVSQLKLVETFLQEVFKDFNLSRKNFNKVLLCISEAVINSIQHGNKSNKNKTVSIRIDCVEKQLDICIKDEGNGFDINGIVDPTKEENLKKESGRGLHIIKSLSNNIDYNYEENFIQIKFECP